ncbi:penicillin-binding protein 2 [Candidatus Saccharibacteria bacterium]|nr:penicillin-binding protein 2 [Candidatus Saccharibacteria bacterium]
MNPIPHALTGRTRVIAVLFLIIGAIFVMRLFYLQVIRHDYYAGRAAAAHESKFDLPATRGTIYAKSGDQVVPLVMNEPVYTVYADPHIIKDEKDKQQIVDVMKRVAGGELVEGFEKRLDNKQSMYAVMARQVSKKQADMIKAEKLPGVGAQESQKRVYPEGALAASILGFVDREGKGQYGVEGSMEERLRGEDGLRTADVDVNGVPLTVRSSTDVIRQPRDGDNVVLSIDRNIQAYAEGALDRGLKNAKATRGSLLVMDPNNGRVLAMANLPSFDPAKYYENEDYAVFQNPIVSDPYEAGSGIKTLTMAAGLNEGVVKPETTFNNLGYDTIDGIKIKNALSTQNIGTNDMTQVLQFSLNSGVMFVLKQMGGGRVNDKARSTLYSYLHDRYRLNEPTGIEQTNEQKGSMYRPDEELGNNVQYATMAFGQGFSVTMLRAASAFGSIINGGKLYKPTLVEGVRDAKGALIEQQPELERGDVVSPETSGTIREMIHQARTRGFGTVDKPGYLIGGKTGTSQTIDPKTGKYREDQTIATYTGFGGNETPRYVVMVRIVDSQLPGFGGTVAAQPIFADMSNWLLEYMRVPTIK